MKVYLSPSSQPNNAFAYGNTNEQAQMNRVADAAKVALEKAGHQVKKAPAGQGFVQNVAESNAWGADVHVPIHSNAGGGRGTEVFCYPSMTANKFVTGVYNALVAINPNGGRGIKGTTSLYEVTATNAVCVYPEVSFHDNPTEAKWIIDNVELIGQAIAKGLTGVVSATPPVTTPATTAPATSVPKPAAQVKSIATLADEVEAGKWGNNPDRAKRLTAAGYNAAAVQAEVNRRYFGAAKMPVPQPTQPLDSIAREVIALKWGNGADRIKRLTAAGYDAAAVQLRVNQILGFVPVTTSAKATASSKTVAQLTQEVWDGKWGNNPERAKRLTAAGYDAAAVQAEINRQDAARKK